MKMDGDDDCDASFMRRAGTSSGGDDGEGV